jgi:hypothetical protein
MSWRDANTHGRARPPGAPLRPQRGCVQQTKSSSSRYVVNYAAKTSSEIRKSPTPFSIQLNSEINTMFGARTLSA